MFRCSMNRSLSYKVSAVYMDPFTAAAGQICGADVAAGARDDDDACAECLAMKRVGAEHLQ